MNYDELYSLLVRFVDGETTAEESVVMEDLIQNDLNWKKEYELLIQLNSSISNTYQYSTHAHTLENWESLKESLIPQKYANSVWIGFAKYAVAASIIFVAGWLFFKLNPNKNDFSEFKPGTSYQTKSNENLAITLSDGSKIVLNENSKLILDANFNKKERLIEMEGEIYFEVAKNENKPFIAKVNNTYTQVLGTCFEIESKANQQVQVSLYNGKIKFYTEEKDEELKAGQKVIYNSNNENLTIQKVPHLKKDTWVDHLSFKDAKLFSIINKLQNHYQIVISAPTHLQNEQYTVSFEGLDLLASLRLLGEITDSKITKQGEFYILNP